MYAWCFVLTGIQYVQRTTVVISDRLREPSSRNERDLQVVAVSSVTSWPPNTIMSPFTPPLGRYCKTAVLFTYLLLQISCSTVMTVRNVTSLYTKSDCSPMRMTWKKTADGLRAKLPSASLKMHFAGTLPSMIKRRRIGRFWSNPLSKSFRGMTAACQDTRPGQFRTRILSETYEYF